ncbi:aldo/keto reductase [Flectobacillus rivi]|uniref:Aldo/keto reductase n=1 Tax=Flectobacillus rivi TaxID=2984209 RepID=A0ABT6YVP5_9BACT|nr:aldo/keto reductase [Flectobacillus rivi]MDI9872943.1 aldo/keto reductase [Flectobacillus rivi]
MIFNENYILSNGVEIPKLGLGTWEISDATAAQTVKKALEIGYRHIDSAQGYGNERGIGEGLRISDVKRSEVFVTTKLDAAIKSYKDAILSIDESLHNMQLDYIDLMLIHSPKPWQKFHEQEQYFEANAEVWRSFEEAYKMGKLRAIGVSNFKESDIDNILESCSIAPMVNQILAHISNTPLDLIRYTQEKGILVEAYSPIGHGELLKNKEIAVVANKYNVSIAQLSIRYCLQLGMLPLPKTDNPDRMKINTQIDFEIKKEDMDFLKRISPIENYGEFSVFPVFGGRI